MHWLSCILDPPWKSTIMWYISCLGKSPQICICKISCISSLPWKSRQIGCIFDSPWKISCDVVYYYVAYASRNFHIKKPTGDRLPVGIRNHASRLFTSTFSGWRGEKASVTTLGRSWNVYCCIRALDDVTAESKDGPLNYNVFIMAFIRNKQLPVFCFFDFICFSGPENDTAVLGPCFTTLLTVFCVQLRRTRFWVHLLLLYLWLKEENT